MHSLAKTCLNLVILAIAAGTAAAADYDAAMAPYHTAFDAAQNEMASANRLNTVHDRAGTCMALSAAVIDFTSAASALDPVFAVLAGDTALDDAKRAGLTAQAQQARDVAQQNADGAKAARDTMCG